MTGVSTMKIELTNVTKRYGSITALDDCTVTIPSGSVCGVLGTNGAGKTTLFHLLVGLTTVDDGSISIGGRQVTEGDVSVREHVGFLPERVGFPAELTAREILRTHASIRGIRDGAVVDQTLEMVELDYAADRRVRGFSNGMQGRLGLATAILSRPSVLILDEPTAGLDPTGVRRFYRIVERLVASTDATVLLATHDLANVERLCDRAVVLEGGQVILDAPVEALNSQSAPITTIHAIQPIAPLAAQAIIDELPSARIEDATEEVISISVQTDALVECINLIDDTLDPERYEIQHQDLEDAFVNLIESPKGEPA